MSKKIIRKISNKIGLSFLLNIYFERRYKREIEKAFSLTQVLSYKSALNRYKYLVKFIPKRATVVVKLRNIVMLKLREKRFKNSIPHQIVEYMNKYNFKDVVEAYYIYSYEKKIHRIFK